MKCPCNECICLPICYSKTLWGRIQDCVLAKNYVYKGDVKLYDIMKSLVNIESTKGDL